MPQNQQALISSRLTVPVTFLVSAWTVGKHLALKLVRNFKTKCSAECTTLQDEK
jgi:hypothetical protein